MIGVTDLRKGSAFELDGQPFLVMKYKHAALGRKKARVKLTIRNLKTNRVGERTFLSNKKLEPIELESRFLVFQEIPKEILKEKGKFLKKNQKLKVLFWQDKPLSLELPTNVSLEVMEASPGAKGNTSANAYKPARLENGLQVKVPLFINVNDIIKVDTRSGEYLGRI